VELFANPEEQRRVWAGVICVTSYPVFLYFNFSGYMDIVLGVGRLLGMQLPENFNRPFLATSFVDFWSRFHITLSSWLRDYVNTPLLRMLMLRFPEPELDPFLAACGFFVTFCVMGFWHGPTLNFTLYGVLLASGMSTNVFWQAAAIKRLGRNRYASLAATVAYRACARGLTFSWYAISMVLFWASTEEAHGIVRVLGPRGTVACGIIIFVAAVLGLAVLEYGAEFARKQLSGERNLAAGGYLRVARAALIWACVIVYSFTFHSAPDIVYKSF
jgi:D-alanyl-lipoteichoic acid acyltransferase DltB (MBOAT superfamily)